MGIRLHVVSKVDDIWKTCCALHNMLLHVDGLNKPWDGVNMPSSDYEGRFGEFDFDDVPLSMQRLYSPEEIRAYDASSTNGTSGCSSSSDGSGSDDHRVDGVRIVRNLSLGYFRSRLVEHFDILFHKGMIKWPRSRGQPPISKADTGRG
jgi:hypothetical protein